MPHPSDFDFYLNNGCEVMDQTLGFQKMPEGYHLMLDADGMYFFWLEKATGRESINHWDKWVVWRSACKEAKREQQ